METLKGMFQALCGSAKSETVSDLDVPKNLNNTEYEQGPVETDQDQMFPLEDNTEDEEEDNEEAMKAAVLQAAGLEDESPRKEEEEEENIPPPRPQGELTPAEAKALVDEEASEVTVEIEIKDPKENLVETPKDEQENIEHVEVTKDEEETTSIDAEGLLKTASKQSWGHGVAGEAVVEANIDPEKDNQETEHEPHPPTDAPSKKNKSILSFFSCAVPKRSKRKKHSKSRSSKSKSDSVTSQKEVPQDNNEINGDEPVALVGMDGNSWEKSQEF